MTFDFYNILIIFYFFVTILKGIKATLSWLSILKITNETGAKLLTAPPHMKRYLTLSTLFWPFYMLTENPIQLFAKTFFSRYGDPGVFYHNDQGLRNFLNDIFKGKIATKILNQMLKLSPYIKTQKFIKN